MFLFQSLVLPESPFWKKETGRAHSSSSPALFEQKEISPFAEPQPPSEVGIFAEPNHVFCDLRRK